MSCQLYWTSTTHTDTHFHTCPDPVRIYAPSLTLVFLSTEAVTELQELPRSGLLLRVTVAEGLPCHRDRVWNHILHRWGEGKVVHFGVGIADLSSMHGTHSAG